MIRRRLFLRHICRDHSQLSRGISSSSSLAATTAVLPSLSVALSGVLFRQTPVRLSVIFEGSLANTPSGYIQDPASHPRQMVSYGSEVSQESEALLDRMEREQDLLFSASQFYAGYTTRAVQRAKAVVLASASTQAQVAAALESLKREKAAMVKLLGTRARRPLPIERVLGLASQREAFLKAQEQQRRREQVGGNWINGENTNIIDGGQDKGFHVVVNADGTETIVRHNRRASAEELLAGSGGRSTHSFSPVAAHQRRPQEHEQDETRGEKPEANAASPSAHAVAAGEVAGEEEEMELLEAERLAREDDAFMQMIEETSGEAALGDEVTVGVLDVHHVNYLMAIAHRRLREFDQAEALLLSILVNDPSSIDAQESLLEIYTGLQQPQKIAELIEFLAEAQAESERQELEAGEGRGTTQEDGRNTAAAAAAAATASEEGEEEAALKDMNPVETCFSILANLIVDAAVVSYLQEGEGATSREFLSMLGPLAHVLGTARVGYLLEALFQTLDKRYYIAVFSTKNRRKGEAAARAAREAPKDLNPLVRPDPNEEAVKRVDNAIPVIGVHSEEARLAQGVFVAFMKMLIARDMHKSVQDPLSFQFFVFSKMYTVLRGQPSRVHEAKHMAERALKLYRENSSHYDRRMRAKKAHSSSGSSNAAPAAAAEKKEKEEGEEPLPPKALDALDEAYQSLYFMYVNDAARERPDLGRRLCLEAVEELPLAASPWETYAFVLFAEDPKGNLDSAIRAAQYAFRLDPLRLSTVAFLATLFEADRQPELCSVMADRFRLLTFLMEAGATEEEMHATADEVLLLLQEHASLSAEQKEARRQAILASFEGPMRQYTERLEQATSYSLPLDSHEREVFDLPELIIPAPPKKEEAESMETQKFRIRKGRA